MTKPDVSIIITAHHEGIIAGVTAKSALVAAANAEAKGYTCEFVVVLDFADNVTSQILRGALPETTRFLETEEGDPGMARNQGVLAATGRVSTFLDADDLWSENWLTAALEFQERHPDAILHCACIVEFGSRTGFWWHADSDTKSCDPQYLEWLNYWDAMALASTELLKQYPFRRNDLKLGYGHEDWHWNRVTLCMGVAHKPVPETIHFKRKRGGSQSELVSIAGGVPWPENELG